MSPWRRLDRVTAILFVATFLAGLWLSAHQ